MPATGTDSLAAELGGVTSWLHISWGHGGTPGGTTLLLKSQCHAHDPGAVEANGCCLSAFTSSGVHPCKLHLESEIKGVRECHKKLHWICKLSFQYIHRLCVKVAEE